MKKISFAHFLKGATKPKASESESDEDENPKGKDGDDADEADDTDADAEAEAEGDEDEADAEGDDDDADASAKASQKKALAAARKEGRMAERERCAGIFGSEHAASKTALACSLAFETSLSVKEAVGILSKAEAGTPDSLAKRMAGIKQPKLGNGAGGGGEADAGASLLARAEARYAKKK